VVDEGLVPGLIANGFLKTSTIWSGGVFLRFGSGDWKVGKEAIVPNQAHGRIAYCFHARDVNLVMGAAARGTPARYRVLLDGQPPDIAHGTDVDGQGNGTVVEQRPYQLIRQSGPIADRQFEIEFLDPGAQAFDFTFG
jgi:hypothetical protein